MKINSLKSQIFVYFSISMILSVLLLGTLFFKIFSSVITKEAILKATSNVEKSGKNLEQYINQLDELSQILESESNINSFFNNDKVNDTLKTDVENMLQNIVKIKSDVVSIVLVGRDGRLVSNEKYLPMELSKDMMLMPWYKNALKEHGRPFLTSARMQDFSMDKNTWVISAGTAINNNEGHNIGVILIDLKYNLVENVVGDMDLGKTGYIYIINDNGQLVYHKNPSYFSNTKQIEALKKLAFSGIDKLNSMIVTRYHVDNSNWNLVALTSLDSMLTIKKDLLEAIAIFSSILLCTSLILSIIFAKKIILPLSELESIMSKVEEGNLEVPLYSSNTYEIQSLSKKFYNMLAKIRLLMGNIKKQEKVLRDTELFALQSQINPHFLYNSLETIIWMAEFKDVDKVIAITSSLSRFFRLSLKEGNGVTSLGDEIEHIRQYLYIQSYRYEDLIEYKIDIDDKFLEIQVPKLILQPIVENAIDHGLRHVKKGGILKIYAEKTDEGNVIIFIKDNGIGFHCPKDYFLPTKDMLEHSDRENIFNVKSSQNKSCKKSSGVGLKNVALRINLFYGVNAGVIINSSSGGTEVKVILGNAD